MIFKDYYKILALETNKASLDEIKTAYREQAKKYHPDVNIGNKNTEERFKDINEAYKILSNQTTKRKYDRMWNSNVGRKKTKKTFKKETPSEAILNILFGNNIKKKDEESNIIINKETKNKPIQGENIETLIDVSINDAFYGKNKEISLRAVNGKMKTFDIKIPEGIRNGEKIRLIGQGKPGINGGKNGNLLIKINIKNDNKYTLIGNDIIKKVYITPWEAALGAKVEVKNIDELLYVFIPKCSQTDDNVKIEQKGYKDGKGGRGNLILQLKIVLPKTITEDEKNIYKKLEKISKFNPRQIYD